MILEGRVRGYWVGVQTCRLVTRTLLPSERRVARPVKVPLSFLSGRPGVLVLISKPAIRGLWKLRLSSMLGLPQSVVE